MSAEIEPARNEQQLDLAGAPTTLMRWAETARVVHSVAVLLARTSFVPASMKGKPEEVTASIMAGEELGLGPMVSLRSIDIIDGSPAMRALLLRGLVQSHGHQIEKVESTETRAVVRGRRRYGPGWGEWQESIWTLDRAKKAGLDRKRNWQTSTQAMLIARATAEVCRLVAADALIGMPYSTEEMQDGVDTVEATTNADATPRPSLVQRAEPVQRAELPAPREATDDTDDWPELPTIIDAGGDDE